MIEVVLNAQMQFHVEAEEALEWRLQPSGREEEEEENKADQS